MIQSCRFAVATLFLAACGAPLSTGQPVAFTPDRSTVPASKTPSELLYVTGGDRSSRHPVIEVFDGNDKSKNPAPLYAIQPRGGGEYGPMAVDGGNNLYVFNYFANAAELDVFPSMKTKPSVSCLLDVSGFGITVAGNVLFTTTPDYTIREYDLPLHAGKACPNPDKTLTDDRAKLRGEFFFAVAADGQGDLFDTWQSVAGYDYIDKFRHGSDHAARYAPLHDSASFYMASDVKGDLAVSVSPGGSSQGNDIAIFDSGSRHPKLYDPIPNGQYLGFAFADHDTELFAAKDYPATVVEKFSFDPVRGRLGKLERTFSNGVWYYAQPIAVYSRN